MDAASAGFKFLPRGALEWVEGEGMESVPSSKELHKYDIGARVCRVDIHTPELVGVLEGNGWDLRLLVI